MPAETIHGAGPCPLYGYDAPCDHTAEWEKAAFAVSYKVSVLWYGEDAAVYNEAVSIDDEAYRLLTFLIATTFAARPWRFSCVLDDFLASVATDGRELLQLTLRRLQAAGVLHYEELPSAIEPGHVFGGRMHYRVSWVLDVDAWGEIERPSNRQPGGR